MGEQNYISTVAVYLADVVDRSGRSDESEALTILVEETAAPDDYAPLAMWRTVRGRILARRGDVQRAEALIREALEILATTDDIDAQAGAYAELAEVLALADRLDAAIAAGQEALVALRGERRDSPGRQGPCLAGGTRIAAPGFVTSLSRRRPHQRGR